MRRIFHIFLLLLIGMAPLALQAQRDSVGVYCPMDFNETFNQEVLTEKFLQSIDHLTDLESMGIGAEVQQVLYGDGYYGDEKDAVLDVARARGLKMVMLLIFSGSESQFMLLDTQHPDKMEAISASLPEDITQDEFADLFQQVTSALLHNFVSPDDDDFTINITKL